MHVYDTGRYIRMVNLAINYGVLQRSHVLITSSLFNLIEYKLHAVLWRCDDLTFQCRMSPMYQKWRYSCKGVMIKDPLITWHSLRIGWHWSWHHVLMLSRTGRDKAEIHNSPLITTLVVYMIHWNLKIWNHNKCLSSTAINGILILTVWGPILDVRIWRL